MIRANKTIWSLIISVLSLILVTCIYAQETLYVLWGEVKDRESGAPLPSANIRLIGSTKGTITNERGMYLILLPPGKHTLIFSYMGYRSYILEIELKDSETRQDILLSPIVLPMPEISVTAYKYNPAERIILQAIAHKNTRHKDLQSYEFQAYTKTVLRVVSDKAGEKDTSIAAILETQTTGRWQRPDLYEEVITARRQSAGIPALMNVIAVGRVPNFDADKIIIGRNSLISPIAANALRYYSYEMIDTTVIDNRKVFRIRVVPGSQLIPLFDGTMSIVDSTFAVIEIDVCGNKAFDLYPVTKTRYRVQFASYLDKYWLPMVVKTDYEVSPALRVQKTSILYNYKINCLKPKEAFSPYSLRILPGADKVDSLSWFSQQTLPLTVEEKQAYGRLDSLMSEASVFAKGLKAIMLFPLIWRNWPVTSFADYFHFNRVEGAYLGFGIRLRKLGKQTTLTMRGGYGFADQIFKYHVGIEQRIPSNGRYTVGIRGYRETAYREIEPVYSKSLVTALCLLGKQDCYDYYLSKGWSVHGKWQLSHYFALDLSYTKETQRSVAKKTDFSLLSRKATYRDNPPILDGLMRTKQVSLIVDTRRFLSTEWANLPNYGYGSWLIRLQTEWSHFEGSDRDFGFNRYFLSIRRYQPTFATWFLLLYLQVGVSTGSVPPQRLFDLTGTIEGTSSFGAFRFLKVKELAGDQFVSLHMEHNFGNTLFQLLKVPLRWEFILTTNAGWSELTWKSQRIQIAEVIPAKKTFMEIGFGIARILGLLRLDFQWGLGYGINKNFALSVNMRSFNY